MTEIISIKIHSSISFNKWSESIKFIAKIRSGNVPHRPTNSIKLLIYYTQYLSLFKSRVYIVICADFFVTDLQLSHECEGETTFALFHETNFLFP